MLVIDELGHMRLDSRRTSSLDVTVSYAIGDWGKASGKNLIVRAAVRAGGSNPFILTFDPLNTTPETTRGPSPEAP